MAEPRLRLEIFEQPEVSATFLDQELASVSGLAPFFRRKPFRQVVITAIMAHAYSAADFLHALIAAVASASSFWGYGQG